MFLFVLVGCASNPVREPASFKITESCREVITHFQDRYILGLKESQLLSSELIPLNNRNISETERSMKFNVIEGELEGIKRSSGSTKPEFLILEGGIKVVWKEHKKIKLANYRAEVLAYELNDLWGIGLVPETVERTIEGKVGSLQLFKESITGPLLDFKIRNEMSAEAIAKVKHNLKKQSLFDYLIENNDRNKNNYLFTIEGDLYSIDNAASFTGIGNYRKSFIERENDIRGFLNTNEGEEVFQSIVSNYNNSFKNQIILYIGKKDANKFFERIERIIQIKN
ncbi:hypothetical protein A9Q84_07985 [Halobacteriovorax marinus]|uniref:Uncharacterized protein n=1 Tax=Halobacteriovorax marinus TaxID=97084 RepID=A0A1Y5F5W7_9BACT|nr:hypothetical protein A9Q84_07985 [Halobacteriovorax marinus]